MRFVVDWLRWLLLVDDVVAIRVPQPLTRYPLRFGFFPVVVVRYGDTVGYRCYSGYEPPVVAWLR